MFKEKPTALSPERRFTYAISTMGCKANLTDSQYLEERLQQLGGAPVGDEGETADFHLLNTCTVTDQADREARRIARRTNSELTVVTGCLAQTDPGQLENISPARGELRVLRNSAKNELEGLVSRWLSGTLEKQRLLAGDAAAWHQSILPARDSNSASPQNAEARTRAFLKVQDGCDAFCSYCVIPLARGRSRSVAATEVVEEVRRVTNSGVQEIVLTAIHAADYFSEGLDFTGLVVRVLRETKVVRLRLTSLDPAEIPASLLALMAAEPRLCPHFHVSVQAANSRVLGAMKRAYNADTLENCLSSIAAQLPHAYVGMDLIAGFPGETEAEFLDGLERLQRLPWSSAHVFPFSVRRNTAAARLVADGHGVAPEIVKERARRLRDLSATKLQATLQKRVGSVMEVLTEAKEGEWKGRTVSQGHSRSFFKVLIPGKLPANQLRRVRITGVADNDKLKGELL